MTAKAPNPMPVGVKRPPAPAAPPNQYNGYQPVLPEPPPMRIGQEGDTIDRAGVRRKADGSLRNFTMDAIRWWGVCAWIGMMLLAVVSYVMRHSV